MNKYKISYWIALGLFLVGFILIGIGIGILLKEKGALSCIGTGIGFIALVIFFLKTYRRFDFFKEKMKDGDEKEKENTSGGTGKKK